MTLNSTITKPNIGQVAPQLDLSGDRAIEWSWVYANIPDGPGFALDFGPGGSQLATVAALKGFDTIGVDMLDQMRPFLLPNLRFYNRDILEIDLPLNHFDLVINCSTVEHVGISGRYNVSNELEDGDLQAMRRLRELMKPEAVQLLTIPIGKDTIWRPLHRIYGAERLPKLLDGYRIISNKCFMKDLYNRWVITEEARAYNQETVPNLYGLGCYKIVRDDVPENIK